MTNWRERFRWMKTGFAAILVMLLGVGISPAADWPQWRGSDGMGISDETGLPLRLDRDSPDLVWTASIPGDGISSPVVSGDRVFVTTAYEGTELSQIKGVSQTILTALGAIALGLLALNLLKRREPVEEATTARRWIDRLDAIFVWLCTIAFFAGLTIVLVQPDRILITGQPGMTWFFTSVICLIGLAAGVGWFSSGSILRLLGTVALLGAAFFCFQYIPLNRYTDEFKPHVKAAMVAPSIAAAFWYGLVFLLCRRDRRATNRIAIAFAITTVAITITTFASHNYFQPSAGLLRVVICYDLESGNEIWRTPLFVAPQERKYDSNTWATPTPCADGEHVFAYFGSACACLDYDGNVRWKKQFHDYASQTRYGTSASPIMSKGRVIIEQQGEKYDKRQIAPSNLLVLDAKTGDEIWCKTIENAHDCYATPIVWNRGEHEELLTSSWGFIVSHDLTTGEELWRVDLPIAQIVPSIVKSDDLLIVAGGTHVEFSNNAMRLKGIGPDTTAEILWQTNKRSLIPEISSPVLYQGLLVVATDNGLVICCDAETGKIHWRKRLGRQYNASLVAGEDRIYAVDDAGQVTVIAAEPEFKTLFEGDLGETCMASPAIANGRILIRTDKNLYCFSAAGGTAL